MFMTWCGWDSQDVFAVLGELCCSIRSVFSVERLVSFTENNLPEVHQTCGQGHTNICLKKQYFLCELSLYYRYLEHIFKVIAKTVSISETNVSVIKCCECNSYWY